MPRYDITTPHNCLELIQDERETRCADCETRISPCGLPFPYFPRQPSRMQVNSSSTVLPAQYLKCRKSKLWDADPPRGATTPTVGAASPIAAASVGASASKQSSDRVLFKQIPTMRGLAMPYTITRPEPMRRRHARCSR